MVNLNSYLMPAIRGTQNFNRCLSDSIYCLQKVILQLINGATLILNNYYCR